MTRQATIGVGERRPPRPQAPDNALLLRESGLINLRSPELASGPLNTRNTQAEECAQEAIILFLEEVARLGTIWEILDEAGLTVHRDLDVAQHLAGVGVGFSIPAAAWLI